MYDLFQVCRADPRYCRLHRARNHCRMLVADLKADDAGKWALMIQSLEAYEEKLATARAERIAELFDEARDE